MIELVLAIQLFIAEPNADSPVCEPGQVSQIDNCTQGQLPEETIGRDLDDPTVVDIDPPYVAIDPVEGPVVVDGPAAVQEPVVETPEPAVTPAPVVEIIDTVSTPELAETGSESQWLWIAGAALVSIGSLLVMGTRGRRDA